MAMDFKKLDDSPHLLDILVQMEDVLDSLDLYVFPNWMKGHVVEGPIVRRYWFDFTLRYEKDNLPDPRGAMRLIKHGVRVDFEKATVEDTEGADPGAFTHWEVKVSIPRKLISDMNAAELDFYDEEIEMEDVQDAQDAGMNDETGVQDQEEGGEGAQNEEQQQNGGEDVLF